jgi:hypothetical protein
VVTAAGGRGIFLNNVTGDAETLFIASGSVEDNVVTGSAQQNIQVVLASDFSGELTGNTGSASSGSHGISVTGGFRFDGEISNNTANDNALSGFNIGVDEFIGDVSGNTAINNQNNGLTFAIDFGDAEIAGNTANLNGVNGINVSVNGDFFTDLDVFGNTTNNNTAEGISTTFGGTGTSVVEVSNNNLSGNNGGIDREFFAQVDDVFENSPTVFIALDGNTSTNALGAGPPFNYDFENSDLFADGQMFVELGVNVGTVGLGEGVELGDSP